MTNKQIPQEEINAACGTSAFTAGLGVPCRRGQLINLKNYGRVRFDRLDFYMGQVTAKLTGIDYPGSYYLFPEVLEKEGYVIIDA